MKILKIILGLFVVLVIALGATAFVEYQKIADLAAPIQTVSFNNQSIPYINASVRYALLNGLVPIEKVYRQESPAPLTSDQILNHLEVPEGAEITLTLPDQSTQITQGSQDLAFEQNGEYEVAIENRLADGSVFHYAFKVDVESAPVIVINDLAPAQGGLLIVDITNLKQDSSIEVESHFEPSAILQKDHSARFYLPMAYREAAQSYPLDITINGEAYDYTIEVQAYAFKEVHFTVKASIVNSTVGNTEAVDQYRATIYPLYETFESVEYWTGDFTLPVAGARESSSFGEMRFVNNAKTATRHAGIDYAVACGTDVSASNAGKVEFAGFLTMIGNTIVIDHGLGLKTFYEHMEDIVITQGDIVEKGQIIGHVGTTGYSTGCHLHFQAMIKNQSINPEFLYKIND